MSRTTFQNALAELFALLADTDGNPVATLATAGAVKVYPFEPGAQGWAHPCSVTLSPSGIDPTDWIVTARVYVGGKVLPAAAQDLLIDVTVCVGDLLFDGVGYGPDRWAFQWVTELDCWVASSEVMIGREDGF